VDTPKGDLNADGYVSGPLTTVVTGSEVYPWGTTEQFPNADQNEGHFYMECSNKGICDRKSGQCDCFDGYGGTACARASCPNECSGHGTCESIKELAEMRSYDTTASHAAADIVAGSSNDPDFNSAVQESYSYDLWDQDKTMGCKCDPVYYGADCSLKKCKYGVDPLFYDSSDGVIYQTTVIHLGSSGKDAAAISGQYKIVFYDVFGEKYVTKAINAAPGTGSEDVRLALEALPNGVISATNMDVTSTSNRKAVTVTAAKTTAADSATSGISTVGGIGQGFEGDNGVGLGTQSGGTTSPYGVEYTVTFKTNPGVLKTIELDTAQVTNPGTSTDYYVANARQGQFHSRYTINSGEVQMINYGSTKLYHNNKLIGTQDVKTLNPIGTLIKLGGQELRVTAVDDYVITLNEAYLGATIEPVKIDTQIVATAVATGTPDTMTVNALPSGTPGSLIAATVAAGTGLVVKSCAYTVKSGGTDIAAAGTTIQLETTHDCEYATGLTEIVYRRSADPNNQNWYRTSDTGALGTASVVVNRGSNQIFHTQDYGQAVSAYAKATGTFTTGTLDTLATTSKLFVNGIGPLMITATAAGTSIIPVNVQDFFSKDFTAAANLRKLQDGQDTSIATGSVLILGGRRYRVAERAAGHCIGGSDGGVACDAAKPMTQAVCEDLACAGGTANGCTAAGKCTWSAAASSKSAIMTLSENYAGGGLHRVCTTCVTAVKLDGTQITVSDKGKAWQVAVGDHVVVGGTVGHDYASAAAGTVDTSAGTITMTAYSQTGAVANVQGRADEGTGLTLPLYKIGFSNYLNGNKPIIVTEAAANANYQYVAQCSNRGSCDAATGLCKCFKGYTNDNCNTQNMLAA